jgi:hypothetical protein
MRKILIILHVVFLTGCLAAGHEYNYEQLSMDIPVEATEQESLILAVEDWRPYVLSGDKKSNFVGLQRDGFGVPFDVDTASGNPLTEIMSAAIENGLKDVGYTVVSVSGNNSGAYLVKAAAKNNASRIVVLKVLDWKSDVMYGVTLHSNLDLSVFDAEGKLLAESSKESMGKISQGSWATGDDNSRALAVEFSRSVSELFDEDQVRRALQ